MAIAPAIGLAAAFAMVKVFPRFGRLVVAGQLPHWYGDQRATLKSQLDRLLGYINTGDPARAARCHEDFAEGGHLCLRRHVILVLIGQATHQATTNAGYFGRIEW